MDSILTNERTWHYPQVEESRYCAMQDISKEHEEKITIFVFFTTDIEGKNYFDIYVWDTMIDNQCVRFIIQKDLKMSNEEEVLFNSYCKLPDKSILMSPYTYRIVKEACDEYYSDIHMPKYKSPGVMLQHLYYTLHEGGVKGMLYKAGLTAWAYRLDELNDYNSLAISPSEIFGLPTRLLWAMNDPRFLIYVNTKEKRELAAKVFYRFYNYIEKDITPCQWIYLQEMFQANMSIDRNVFHYLKNYLSVEEYERFRKICKEEGALYEYEDDNYIVKFPTSVFELLHESINQHNCLINYVDPILSGQSVVVFMRKKTEPEKSYIMIEIEQGIIEQACGCCNRTLTEKERKWIISYAGKIGVWIGASLYEDFYDEE